jgi:homoserine kinase type II
MSILDNDSFWFRILHLYDRGEELSMDSVFLVWYVRAQDGADDEELLIGVYDTEEEAKAAIERLKGKPGFVSAPDRFQIHPYEVNRDHWTEGFIATTD